MAHYFFRHILSVFASVFFISSAWAQQDVNFNKTKFLIEKSHVFDPMSVKPSFEAKISTLEAPKPGGNSYKSFLLKVKREVRKKYPLNFEKSADSISQTLSDPLYIDSFPLKQYILIVNGNDTIINKLDYLRDGGAPLDNTLAVSNDDYLMCGINTKIYMHDLKSGNDPKTADIKVITFANFAQEGGITTSFPFDPKIIYDPDEDRFVLTFLTGRDPSNSGLIIAFSTSSNPQDPWNVYKLSGNPLKNGLWSDYPAIALTKDEVFYTINLLVPGSDWKTTFNQSVIWQIDKYAGYAGESTLTTELWSDISLDGRNLRNLAVVPGAEGPMGPNMYFLSNRNFDVENDTIFLVEVTNKIDNAAAIKIIPLIGDQVYGVPPNGRQANSDPNDPDDGFDTNDARVLGAFQKDNEIQFVGNTVNPKTGLAGIYHGFITNLDSEPVLSGNIIGNTSLDYGYPNIAYTGNGQCINSSVIAFDHTSPTEFAGISAIRYSRDSLGNHLYSKPMFLKKGENYVDKIPGTYERWGDYFGLQRKYNEPGLVYAAGFYGTTDPSLSATFFSKLRDCDCFSVKAVEHPLSEYNKCYGQVVAEVKNALDPVSYTWNGVEGPVNYLNLNLCDYVLDLKVSDVHGCQYTFADSVTKALPKEKNLIYPNPASDEVNIYFSLGRKSDISVYIYSSEGKLAYQLLNQVTTDSGMNLLTFSTAPLQTGLYILTIKEGDKIILKDKLTVTK